MLGEPTQVQDAKTTTSPAVTADGVEQFDGEALNAKAKQTLYAARQKIFPKRAEGTFRRFKWFILIITLGIYYLTPWIRWDRGPGTPDQAVLLDMANRRFYFFFIEIWPHEFFYVAGLLVMAGIGLFLVTSTLGRAWCGYTCPQTVWVDLFLVVERFFEGERAARMRLDKGPWTFEKIWKRVAKHSTWLVIGVLTGGAWIFYFADAPTLLRDLFTGQAIPEAYITIAILTATTYIFGGLMREQVCTYMCPWPRVQAAMLDENSLTVTYNAWRGEQRTHHVKRQRAAGEITGDCVDCNACVAVCPVGIDIRQGQQMECITCALCIDACDSVMTKLGLEKGLIAYSTLDDYASNMRVAGASGLAFDMTTEAVYEQIDPKKVHKPGGGYVDAIRHTTWRSIMRPRTFLYLAIYSGIGLAMLTVFSMRETLDINVLHDRNPLFVKLSDGSIRNGYEVKILNMRGEQRQFWVETIGLEGATMRIAGSQNKPTPSLLMEVTANKLRAVKVYITAPVSALKSRRTNFTIRAIALRGAETTKANVTFEAPPELFK